MTRSGLCPSVQEDLLKWLRRLFVDMNGVWHWAPHRASAQMWARESLTVGGAEQHRPSHLSCPSTLPKQRWVLGGAASRNTEDQGCIPVPSLKDSNWWIMTWSEESDRSGLRKPWDEATVRKVGMLTGGRLLARLHDRFLKILKRELSQFWKTLEKAPRDLPLVLCFCFAMKPGSAASFSKFSLREEAFSPVTQLTEFPCYYFPSQAIYLGPPFLNLGFGNWHSLPPSHRTGLAWCPHPGLFNSIQLRFSWAISHQLLGSPCGWFCLIHTWWWPDFWARSDMLG